MNIVLGSDGSIEADIASAILKKLPIPKDGRFTVAMATAPPATIGMALAPEHSVDAYEVAADAWKIQRQIAEQTVANLSTRLNEAGLTAAPRVLEGEAGAELLTLAKDIQAEVVAIGSGANNRLTAFLLGSVSRKLLLYSDSSILIGRRMEAADHEGTYARLRRKEKLDVLIAYDGTPGAELAIQSLSRLKRPVFGKITVLTINDRIPPFGLEGAEAEEATCDLVKIASGARDRIAVASDTVEIAVGHGIPSQVIASKAKELDVDIIVMGANRHGIMERLIIGSCSYETMLAAPCSVLILRQSLPFE